MRVNDLLARLDNLTYPTTTDGVIAALDDPELQLPAGSDRLSAVFTRTSMTALDCAEDAKISVLSALNEDAIGRKGYSDRDPPVRSGFGGNGF